MTLLLLSYSDSCAMPRPISQGRTNPDYWIGRNRNPNITPGGFSRYMGVKPTDPTDPVVGHAEIREAASRILEKRPELPKDWEHQ